MTLRTDFTQVDAVPVPRDLQSVSPAVLEEYVQSRMNQLVLCLCEELSKHDAPSAAVIRDLSAQIARQLPMPRSTPAPLSSRELMLRYTHDCGALGCLDLQCHLCKDNPYRKCVSNFAPKYCVKDCIRAACNCNLRIELVDCATNQVVTEGVPPLKLEISILDGVMFKTKFLENGDLVEGTDSYNEALDSCAVLTDNKAQPLLTAQSGNASGANDSTGRLVLSMQDGKAELVDVVVIRSSEALLSGRKPPFRLLAKVKAGSTNLRIKPVVSEAFVVNTRRARNDGKACVPQLDDDVGKLDHMGRETVRKLQDLKMAATLAGEKVEIPEISIHTVGEFKQLAVKADQDATLKAKLLHILKLSKDKWEEAKEHALKAVGTDNYMRGWTTRNKLTCVVLLFRCRQGVPELAMPAAYTEKDVISYAVSWKDDTKDILRRLAARARADWLKPGHPNWSVTQLDSELFKQDSMPMSQDLSPFVATTPGPVIQLAANARTHGAATATSSGSGGGGGGDTKDEPSSGKHSSGKRSKSEAHSTPTDPYRPSGMNTSAAASGAFSPSSADPSYLNTTPFEEARGKFLGSTGLYHAHGSPTSVPLSGHVVVNPNGTVMTNGAVKALGTGTNPAGTGNGRAPLNPHGLQVGHMGAQAAPLNGQGNPAPGLGNPMNGHVHSAKGRSTLSANGRSNTMQGRGNQSTAAGAHGQSSPEDPGTMRSVAGPVGLNMHPSLMAAMQAFANRGANQNWDSDPMSVNSTTPSGSGRVPPQSSPALKSGQQSPRPALEHRSTLEHRGSATVNNDGGHAHGGHGTVGAGGYVNSGYGELYNVNAAGDSQYTNKDSSNSNTSPWNGGQPSTPGTPNSPTMSLDRSNTSYPAYMPDAWHNSGERATAWASNNGTVYPVPMSAAPQGYPAPHSPVLPAGAGYPLPRSPGMPNHPRSPMYQTAQPPTVSVPQGYPLSSPAGMSVDPRSLGYSPGRSSTLLGNPHPGGLPPSYSQFIHPSGPQSSPVHYPLQMDGQTGMQAGMFNPQTGMINTSHAEITHASHASMINAPNAAGHTNGTSQAPNGMLDPRTAMMLNPRGSVIHPFQQLGMINPNPTDIMNLSGDVRPWLSLNMPSIDIHAPSIEFTDADPGVPTDAASLQQLFMSFPQPPSLEMGDSLGLLHSLALEDEEEGEGEAGGLERREQQRQA